MTTKKPELPKTKEERRKLLDSLSSRHDKLSSSEIKLHDLLASKVAEDEAIYAPREHESD